MTFENTTVLKVFSESPKTPLKHLDEKTFHPLHDEKYFKPPSQASFLIARQHGSLDANVKLQTVVRTTSEGIQPSTLELLVQLGT